jgi:hypothetical protein
MGSGMNQPLFKLLAPCLLASLPVVAGCSGAANDESLGNSGSAYSESGNEKTAFDFFVGKGLSENQSAGIVGNLIQESNVNPAVSQYGGGPGRGIAQWSEGGRWNSDYHDNVVWYAGTKGQSPYALGLQLDFIWYELTARGYGYGTLRTAPNVTDATIDFEVDFEGCGQCDQGTRIAYAQQVLSEFGGHTSGGGGTTADACNKGSGFCTETLQCDNGHWIIRQDDAAACTTIENVEESCNVGGGYCTETLQCENGHWVPRSGDPAACTSGPGG